MRKAPIPEKYQLYRRRPRTKSEDRRLEDRCNKRRHPWTETRKQKSQKSFAPTAKTKKTLLSTIDITGIVPKAPPGVQSYLQHKCARRDQITQVPEIDMVSDGHLLGF